MATANSTAVRCPICGYSTGTPAPGDLGSVRGNTQRFRGQLFRLWKCPQCATITALDPVSFQDIYRDYALNARRLDMFARGTLGNLRRRLAAAGLRRSDSVLDYGCGNGVFLDYLRQAGYPHVSGYDPYVPRYAQRPATLFDCIVNNDTLEHGEDYRGMIRECLALLKPGGLLYLGTADSEPVDMRNLEPHVMRLHQPFHRVIVTERTLHGLATEFGLTVVQSWRRSYHDTRRPFVNYRFLDELNQTLGHNLDRVLNPRESGPVIARTPRLWFYALFGYWLPSAAEPAVALRRPASTPAPGPE